MWNITPEDVERIKDELKGRHAAIQARYETEIQKLQAELDDAEAVERVAISFVRKHKLEDASALVEPHSIAETQED